MMVYNELIVLASVLILLRANWLNSFSGLLPNQGLHHKKNGFIGLVPNQVLHHQKNGLIGDIMRPMFDRKLIADKNRRVLAVKYRRNTTSRSVPSTTTSTSTTSTTSTTTPAPQVIVVTSKGPTSTSFLRFFLHGPYVLPNGTIVSSYDIYHNFVKQQALSKSELAILARAFPNDTDTNDTGNLTALNSEEQKIGNMTDQLQSKRKKKPGGGGGGPPIKLVGQTSNVKFDSHFDINANMNYSTKSNSNLHEKFKLLYVPGRGTKMVSEYNLTLSSKDKMESNDDLPEQFMDKLCSDLNCPGDELAGKIYQAA